MTVLIAGDSFAADWHEHDCTAQGWCNMLAESHEVKNVAQAGVSEFRILQQIQQAMLQGPWQAVIVAHTSPCRIPTPCHPVHSADSFHGRADLIFSDIEYHSARPVGWFNRPLVSAYDFFLYHYDQEFWHTSYLLLRQEIQRLITVPYLVLASPLVDTVCNSETNVVNIQNEHLSIGQSNHLSHQGNLEVYNSVTHWLTINNIYERQRYGKTI